MLRTHLLASISGLLLLSSCKGAAEDTGAPNTAPKANAGEDQTVSADDPVSLDGSLSSDADGDALSFKWSFDHTPEGSSLDETSFSTNDSSDASQPTFDPDAVGTFVVSLVVSDGRTESTADYVIVTTEDPTSIPTANAGEDSIGQVGQSVLLDGSGSSDPKDRELSYTWNMLQVPSSSGLTELTDSETANPSFTPDVRGVYVFNLVVSNGLTQSQPDTVLITATGEDNSPVASAGEDITAEDCSHIQLDGANSADPDGDTLQYFWELQSKPQGSSATNDNFSDRNAQSPTFWADWAGDYMLSLTVSDGANWSTADTLSITLTDRTSNTVPAINIATLPAVSGGEAECEEDGYVYDCEDCEDQTVEIGPNVTINDSDNDPYTVRWEMTSGSGKVINPESLVTNVKLQGIEATEPSVCDSNEWTLELTVTDCTTAETKKSTTVTVDCCGIEASTTTTSTAK